jgi:hypothetical protein
MYEHIVSELGDRTELIERCVPQYPPYGKRILLDNGWYAMLRRPNVSLVSGFTAADHPRRHRGVRARKVARRPSTPT